MFWFFKKRGDLNKKFEQLKESLSYSFSNVKKDIVLLKDELSLMKEDQNERILELETKVDLLASIIEGKPENKFMLEEKGVIERVQSFNRSGQSFMNVQLIGNLTPAQKQVILLLLHENEAVDYKTIGKRLGINEITARRHINDIERSGVKINKKMSVKTKRKMFFLDDDLKNKLLKSVRQSTKTKK